MTLLHLSLLAFLALSRAAIPNIPTRIIGGDDAAPGEIPYQVSIQYTYINTHFCGGVILNEYYVLTAAHCINDIHPSELTVVAGTNNLRESKNYSHSVEKIIAHEEYDEKNSWVNDIALVKVKEPFVKSNTLSFVTLPESGHNPSPGDTAVVSGWGRLSMGGPPSTLLQRVNIFIESQEECMRIYRNRKIYETHICAYDTTEMKGSCNADSGGPLTIDGKLVGLVSWARGCALTTYPTVFTRVSSYLDWIKMHAV